MTQKTLSHVLEEIKILKTDELRLLEQAVQAQLRQSSGAQKLERFHDALLKSGLVKQIKPPRAIPSGERRLIQAQDKPVSETIVEERR